MDSLLNRSHSTDTATSSVTLPSSLGSSSRKSGAAINSAKRRIDLNTPVINRNGRIEEAGETDDDGRLVDEGGEDDFDAVKDSVKSNDGSLFRRNVTPVRALNKSSAVRKHFKVYPKSLITDPNAFVSEWHKFAVCTTHCYDKHYRRNDSVTTSSLWEVNYGVTHSTSKLVGHFLQRNHIGLYKEDGKAAVEHAANMLLLPSSSCKEEDNRMLVASEYSLIL